MPASSMARAHCMARMDDTGLMIRLAIGTVVMQTATGAIQSLHQRKAQAALDSKTPPAP